MKKFFLSIIFIALVLSVFFAYRFYKTSLSYARNPQGNERVIINIESGSNAKQIASQLKERELIKSELAFRFYLRQQALSDQLKAGRLVIEENKTLPQIINILVEGKSEEMSVTLLEGWTIRQIAEYMEEKGFTTAERFLECVENCDFDFSFLPSGYLEGYLYPDTYFVNPELYTDQDLIARLIGTLESKLSDEDWQAIEASDYSFEEIMIMASMIEREERIESEKATVAGVLWNRFDEGAGLGVDATVLYALGRTSGSLNYDDLQIDSPYNTRKYAGLPPTPISNPGLSSIRAALYPKETEYWYYLHDETGQIHYGKTLEEHNENKRRYLD